MLVQAVNRYISSNIRAPYFLFIGDRHYKSVKDKLAELGFSIVLVSDYCSSNDKLPDIDSLLEYLKAAGLNATDNKLAVIGLGEYLALRGNKKATNILFQLKDLNIRDTKVVLLLRGVTTLIGVLQADPRFDDRRFSMFDRADSDLSFTHVVPSINLSDLKGIKVLLRELENGICGNIFVSTSISLDKALFTVRKISDAYEGIKFVLPNFSLPQSCGNDGQWAELLKELKQNNYSLDAVFKKYGFDSILETDFYIRISRTKYKSWLYFIALKSKSDALVNNYLRYVLDNTGSFEDLKRNALNAIIEIPHNNKLFNIFYADRKTLMGKFPEPDIASFVVDNRKNIAESIFKLTDNTKAECEEIIAWTSKNGIIPELTKIYPAFSAYLKRYTFNCGALSNLLTDYFDAYKRQKVSNKLETDFLNNVEMLAKSRDYNRLPTRNEIIEGLDKDGAYLYWLDAFGVEYLAFIQELVCARGLSLSIKIARAELPTITSINRDFYDAWQGDGKEKNEELDEIKHKDKGGYNFKNNELPIHLAKELDIISEVINKAATELALRRCERFLIVSDHGASRLAVLRCKEEKYGTDTKGEHSGRCCKYFEPYDLPFAAEENGYLVLADYGRFKGSRAANVEVHGGASLEEVVVPIIELTLKDSTVTVEMVESHVTVDFRKGTGATLFFNFPVKNVSIILQGKRYSASQLDAQHFRVELPDIKRAGDYSADVYAGDDLIEKIIIRAQGKSGKIDDAFDDLF